MEKHNPAEDGIFYTQFIPLTLTFGIFILLSSFIFVEILLLNHFTSTDIITRIHWQDFLIGMTIYLKTAVDFAIFIGRVMTQYPGWRNRVAIEIGTAVGNAFGTMIILLIWNVFRNIAWLLAIMIFVASLVLLKLAEEGLEYAQESRDAFPPWFFVFVTRLEKFLEGINTFTSPLFKYLMPHATMKASNVKLTFVGLFSLSFGVPFILGLDDFAGYVPLFNVVNLFGFSVGVLAGHMILNFALFLAPKKTTTFIKNPLISVVGGVVFIFLAVWGLYEAIETWIHLVHIPH